MISCDRCKVEAKDGDEKFVVRIVAHQLDAEPGYVHSANLPEMPERNHHLCKTCRKALWDAMTATMTRTLGAPKPMTLTEIAERAAEDRWFREHAERKRAVTDEVAVYPRALSAEETKALYEACRNSAAKVQYIQPAAGTPAGKVDGVEVWTKTWAEADRVRKWVKGAEQDKHWAAVRHAFDVLDAKRPPPAPVVKHIYHPAPRTTWLAWAVVAFGVAVLVLSQWRAW